MTNVLTSQLIDAIRRNDINGVIAQLELGADPNSYEDEVKMTPLHYAAQFGFVGAVVVLIKAGADIEAKAEGGTTAAEMARLYGHEAIGELLEGSI